MRKRHYTLGFLAVGLAILLIGTLGRASAMPPQQGDGTPEPADEPPLPPGIADFDEMVALFNYDADIPLDIQEIGLEDRDGVAIHDITFANSIDDEPVAAYLVVPPGDGPFAAVLYVHWLGGRSSSNRGQYLDEAITLAGQGVVSLLIDTAWTDAETFWDKDADHDAAVSVKQVIEIRRALDVLAAQPQVDPERIGIVAHDFGAMYAAVAAAVDGRVKTLVLLAGTPYLSDWFVPYGGGRLSSDEQPAYIEAMNPYDPIFYVSHLAPASVFFQFGEFDNFVPDEKAQEFFDAASEPKQMTIYADAHQLFLEDDDVDRLAWLTEHLSLATD
ncbi:MAG: acetylxylan esterase [Anaerolineae bacterium]|nr:acetylxylan esterase [Anaerolineae bacterium]